MLGAMMTAALAVANAQDAAPTCEHVRYQTYFTTNRKIIRRGDTVEVRVVYRDGPDGEKVPPMRCLTHWKIDAPGVEMKRERNIVTLRIGEDAPVDRLVTLSARIGPRTVEGKFHILTRDEPVLWGVWRQERATGICADDRPVREIEFFDGGTYELFFRPRFETMVESDGSYAWDKATGAFTYGNQHGTARLTGEGLVVEGVRFDFQAPPHFVETRHEDGSVTMEPAPIDCRFLFR